MGKLLDPWSSQRLLEKYVPFPPTYMTTDVDLGMRFARNHYPVVLKAVTDKMVHKSDAGAVVLNVSNDDEFIQHFYRLQDRFGPKILIQKQVSGIELFVGGKRDPQFGPVVLFGLGGIFVEVYKDVSARVVPITKEDAFEMMTELRGKKILEGARGVYVNKEKLADILVSFSRFLMENEGVEEVDLNPVIAKGDEIYAVDARVIMRRV